MNDEYTDNETQNIVNDTKNTVSDTTTPVEETIETVTSETPASETGAVNTNEQKTEAFESKASEETTDNTTSDNPAGINDAIAEARKVLAEHIGWSFKKTSWRHLFLGYNYYPDQALNIIKTSKKYIKKYYYDKRETVYTCAVEIGYSCG